MKVVYKYKLKVGINAISLPKNSESLSVAFQGDDLCMWIEVNPDNNPTEDVVRYFEAFGTGYEFSDNHIISFIGTAFLYDASFVVHVYEVLNELS